MRRCYFLLLAASVLTVGLLPVVADSPVPVQDLAPLDDLVFEVNDRVQELDKLLATEASFEEKKGEDVRRGFGVLAVVGQAIGEHGDHDQTDIQGAALREAARQYTTKSTYAEAQSALAAVHQAQQGMADGDAPVEYDWAKLINMHPMMEEIEERTGKINRVVRKPRGKPDEPVHASVIAVLTLAMQADTHEVKNPDDVPHWNELAKEYRGQMLGVAAAIRDKDKQTAGALMAQATETCDKCHEKFRD